MLPLEPSCQDINLNTMQRLAESWDCTTWPWRSLLQACFSWAVRIQGSGFRVRKARARLVFSLRLKALKP